MQAVYFTEYGSPEVLQLKNIPTPVPREKEVLVRIYASAVNSGDIRLRKADPFAVRLMLGLFKPRINILGVVFAGKVEAVGKNVSRFKVGDELFGMTNMKFGAYAEYKCFHEKEVLALKPESLSFTEAAVLPFGGTTALHFLKKAELKPGQKVLIYGASGAVGTAAIQLARYFGAVVTGVCSTTNLELVKSLGASRVIDYTKENFWKMPEQYDVIFDTVNQVPVSLGLKKLYEGGSFILGAAGLGEMIKGKILIRGSSKKVEFGLCQKTADDIAFLGRLAKEGRFKPVIDKTFSLEKIAEAHSYVEKGHKIGNVALTI